VGTVNTVVDAIKAKTDNLSFTGTDVKATLDGEKVTLAATQGDYAPAKAGDKMDLVDAPNSTALGAIKDAVQGAGTTLATLLSRIVGTLASGTHSPQSGDAYAIVNHATYGNSAIHSDLAAVQADIDGMATDVDIADAVWAALTSGLTTLGSIGKYILDHIVGVLATGNHSPQSGDTYGVVSNETYGNAAIKTETAAIKTKTDTIPASRGSGRIGYDAGRRGHNGRQDSLQRHHCR
jgi:hypothetical protein